MPRDWGNKEDLLPHPVPRDFIDREFDRPGGVSLEVRIWPAPAPIADPTSSASPPAPPGPRPWVLWVHGGAYSAGAHYAPPSWVVPGFRQRGFHVVTAAYRLSPQVGLEEQVADLLRAHAWCREHLASELGGPDRVDVDRFAIGGDSAGGTLATLLGYNMRSLPPRAPSCIIDVYGNTDLLDEAQHWSVRDSSVYEGTHPLGEVLTMLTNRDPAAAVVACPFPPELARVPEAVTQDRWARPDFTYSLRVRLQAAVKDYMAQTRSNIYHLLRLDRFPPSPGGGREEARAYARTVSPVHLVGAPGSGPYPPTVFLHGDADASVPIRFAREFEAALRAKGVATAHSWAEGAPHAFDMVFTGPGAEGWDEYIAPVLDFVEEHV